MPYSDRSFGRTGRRTFLGFAAGALGGMTWPGCRAFASDASRWPVPAAPRADAPDYWCTWDTQAALAGGACGYRVALPDFPADQGRPGVRDYLNEDILFGARGLARLYPDCRDRLCLVLDDGWDVPYGADNHRKDISVFSSLEPDPKRFPSLKGAPGARLRQLAARVRDAGWRGLGLWVACQPSGALAHARTDDPRVADQLKRKLAWCAEAGVAYWKVDWGTHNRDVPFRRLLTELKNRICPGLLIEHCRGFDNGLNGTPGMPRRPDGTPDFTGPDGRCHGNPRYDAVTRQATEIMAVSDTFRTYDVACPMTTATALDRAAWAVSIADGLRAHAVVNIEDEAVAAVGLGLATGVMRSAPNRSYAKVSPRTTYNRLREIDRVLRWRQLAPAFGSHLGAPLRVSSETLAESYHYVPGSTWLQPLVGHTFEQRAAARMARGMALPVVSGTAGAAPFVVASKNPLSGAVTLAVLPRLTCAKGYHTPPADVALPVTVDARVPFAVFGEPRSVTVNAPAAPRAVFVQDAAGGAAVDIAGACSWHAGRLTLPGAALARIGRALNGPGDLSSPGVMIRLA